MFGLGTQDDLDLAIDFVETRGTESFTMLWDPTFLSWDELGISGQPAAILFAPDGTELGRWQGAFPPGEVLDLAAAV